MLTNVHVTKTNWRAVASLGLGAFAIVSAEFLPVGMLSEVADDLDVSLGAASAVVLVPGLVAGISAPFVVTLVRSWDRRQLVLLMTGLLVVSNLVTWLTPSFGVLLIARFLVGLALGGFWAVGPSLGVRLASAAHGKVATSIVLAGISAGTVLGLPLGQVVSSISSWRTVFIGAAVVGLLVLGLQFFWLPRLDGALPVGARDLMQVVRQKPSRVVLVVTVVGISAQLMVQTYISVYLSDVGALDSSQSSVVLLFFGICGLAGNLLAPRVPLSLPRLFAISAAIVGIIFLVMPFVGGSQWFAVALVLVWGLLWGGIPFMLQTWTISTTQERPEAGSAVLVTFFQISIAIGSTLGGVLVTVGGLSGTLVVAGALQLLASLLAFGLAASRGKRRRATFSRPGSL
jgi:predicted MFS family arabinose efflux permease